MNGYNRVTIAGNLTRDVEVRYTASGTPVATLGIAVNRTWTDSQGEKKEETTFVDVVAWSKAAETLAQYCKKGRPLLVEGRLKMETWEDADTQEKRSKMVVVMEEFVFLNEGHKTEASKPAGRGRGR